MLSVERTNPHHRRSSLQGDGLRSSSNLPVGKEDGPRKLGRQVTESSWEEFKEAPHASGRILSAGFVSSTKVVLLF